MKTECGADSNLECTGPGWCIDCTPFGRDFHDPKHPDNFRNRRRTVQLELFTADELETFGMKDEVG